MDILVITWNYPPRQGGMEQLLANVCGGLSKSHGVSVITAHASASESVAGEAIYRPRSPGLLRFFLFAMVKGIGLLWRQHSIEVVFGGSVLVTPIVLLLARMFGRKAVVQAHGLDLIYRHPVYQLAVVQWLRYVDHVIANSRHTALLAQRTGVAEQMITVIPPGVDWQRFQVSESSVALKQAWGLTDRKVILFVGRLARRKGVKEFIEHSLTNIAKQVPEVCFVIAGGNPTESLTHHEDVASEIRQAIARHDLVHRARMLGAVTDADLVQLYALCDVVVLPVLDLATDVEGFGMVALEAAAAGKPVVATRCGGIADAVEDGVSGVLVPPGDYPKMSGAMIGLLDDEQRLKTLGHSALRRAQADFSWTTVIARYEQSFLEGMARTAPTEANDL